MQFNDFKIENNYERNQTNEARLIKHTNLDRMFQLLSWNLVKIFQNPLQLTCFQ